MASKTKKYLSPDGEREITARQLSKLDRELQISVMRDWFRERFMDPIELPHDSGEGGYQWIWGAASEPEDVLDQEFSGTVDDDVIAELSEELSEISHEWSPQPDENDFYRDDWVPEDLESPYMELVSALNQIGLVAKEKRSIIDGPLVYRLLYLNIIIALETYLGDSFSAVVLKRRPYLEQFVHHSSHLREKQISLSDIFMRAKTIEGDVRGFIGGISWHDLSVVAKIYKQAFGFKIPEIPEEIRAGIKLRHDIVHRNGKTPEGLEQSWKKGQITTLKEAVQMFVTEIEILLKDLPEDPNSPKPEPDF